MAMIEVDGCALNVEVDGPDAAPVLMLSNSLGTDLHMWDGQMSGFTTQFRVVRYDRRGHGKSAVPPGPYTMERLGRDVVGILDQLGIEKINWCGLSMGGMVGQWLGANAPGRIDRLVLTNTSCYYPAKEPWHERIATVRQNGVASIADAMMGRWFTQGFIEREPATVAAVKDMMIATPAAGFIANCEAVRDMDHRDILPSIKAPTLMVAGRYDVATPVEAVEYIRARIPGAALTLLDAGHMSNIEQASDFTAEVIGFLTSK